MAILDKEFFTKALKEEIKAEIPSLTIKENPDSVLVSGTFCMIQNLYGFLQGKLKTEKPSDTLENEWRPTDNQADLVCVPSALYEYIMEIYRAEIDNIERRYNVTIGVNSTSEGSTYVRFTSQDRSKSSPEKAKKTFTDKVQKVTGDWSQEMVDLSVVPLTLSEIKQQVKDRWSNILVLQEGDKYLILRGPRDELSQVKTFLEKGDYKSARCPVTISSRDLKTEILVDPRHMEILKKLKYREIGEIEQKNDVNIEEQRKNGSILVTFRALNAPPDLSPHASHSFITLLQKTFFNIEKKVISINPDFMDNISILQEDLKMRGVDIVMEYSRGSVVLIGHPINVAFAAEKLTDIQNPGRGQAAAAIEEPMDTNSSTDDKQKTEEADKCPICLCEVEDKVILEKCKHAYCKGCLQTSMAHKPVCAVCGVAYGTIIGNQPDGTMRETTRRSSLPGFVGCDTIVIQYNFPGGVQKKNHPNPGKYFSGTSRTTYLPDNKEGRQILSLLKKAFDQRLIFTVGESRTTGAKDTVTWNDIHHKTSMTGGPQK
uniref:E3 ubiquitin-protein ligase n=1 Tax=Pyxicephalus adspersus TaxID=30357 RepID=A0AAV2ZXS2_PYXAD|nr:TPA: hypothetical protein GDO54_015354 [Pyxicephalus adspersus]